METFRRSDLLKLLATPLAILLIGCQSSSDSDRDGDQAADSGSPETEQRATVSRDEIKFISRPSEKNSGGIPLLDLLLKVGNNEIEIGSSENPWSEVEPGGSKAPKDAIVAARLGYAGGADWFFVVEEDEHYVLKSTRDDEGSFGGEGSLVEELDKAKVYAVFSKTGEAIRIPGFDRGDE